MFVDYEGDVNDLLAQAEAAADPTALLQEVNDLIQQMKLEVRTMAGGEKATSLATVQVRPWVAVKVVVERFTVFRGVGLTGRRFLDS